MSSPFHDPLLAHMALKQIVWPQMNKHLEAAPENIVGKYKHDPLGFVMSEWPWGEKDGPLEHAAGPDEHQKKFLIELGEETKEHSFDGHTPVAPVRMSISSAHGCGKSTLGAWLAWWILRTRPESIGTVTAGTYQQLEERTWSEIMHWGRMARGGHYFDIQNSGVFHKDPKYRQKWKCTPKTAAAERAQSFAGQHARTSTSFFIFDEASEVPDANWTTAYGGLTDGEPMMFAWGQMISTTGEFYRVSFGDASDRWNTRIWDGRESAFTNKDLIDEWKEEYGEDSDFFRVRVSGLPPRASSLQYIHQDLVDEARKREHNVLDDEPLIVGYDAANGGLAKHMFVFRRGLDSKSIRHIWLPGDTHRDAVVAKAAEIMSDKTPGRKVAALFGDTAFGAVIVANLQRSGFTNAFDINFGAPSHDKNFLNMRSFMWGQVKEWLRMGAIEDDEKLAQEFLGPGFHHRNGKLVLESKADMAKRGVKSPDYVDALCFVAGTMIQTPTGLVPIEDLWIGDLVTTPFGPSPVAAAWCSLADKLTSTTFSNGIHVTGKPEHEIFTFSSGVKRLDALSLTDEVDTYSRWRLLLWRIVSLCFTETRNFGFKQAADTFNPGERVRRRDFCIAACTSTISALYQKITTFITKMTTGVIANPATWKLSLQPFTSATMPSKSFWTRFSERLARSILNGYVQQHQSGTVLPKASFGIASTAKSLGKQGQPQRSNASAVGKISKPTLRIEKKNANPSTVQVHACRRSLSGRISQNVDRACSAARILWQTVTGTRPVVPISVQTENVPLTPTFNLTLREHNAYYANGILVFNCLTFARKVAPLPIAPPKKKAEWRTTGDPSVAWMG